MKIGTVTIGQSPRTDITPEFRHAVGFDIEIEERGALDGLSFDEVGDLAPRPGDDVLVTRMADGTEVTISEARILDRMQQHVLELSRQNDIEFVVLFCTGEFPDFRSEKILIRPERLLRKVIEGVAATGTLGAVVPAEEQIEQMKQKWAATGLDVVSEAISPYSASEAQWRETAHRLSKNKPDLVVMDCLGFNERARAVFREVTGVPTIVPRSILGRVTGELLAGRATG